MRHAVWVGVLVCAFVAGVPWWAGRGIEARYVAFFEDAEGSVPFAVDTSRYERGLFVSEVVTVLEPVASDPALAGAGPGEALEAFVEPEPAMRLVLRHEIAHGPYPLAWLRAGGFDGSPVLAFVTTRPVIEIETAEAVEEIALPVVMESRFTREAGASIRLLPDAEAETFQDPELDADWRDTFAQLDLDPDGSRVQGRLAVPRLRFDGDPGALRLAGLDYRFAYDRVGEVLAQPLYVGGSQFRLATAVVEADGERFELHDLEMHDQSDVVDAAWSLDVSASLGRVGSPERFYGPAELDYRMAGLAVEPLAELGALAAAIEDGEAAPDARKAEALGALGALWPQLMAAGPELEISRLRFVTPDGEIRLTLRVGVDPSEPALLQNPFMTLPALEVDAQIALPARLIEGRPLVSAPVLGALSNPAAPSGPPAWLAGALAAQGGVEDWLAQGLVERHGESFTTSLRVRQGALRVNGRVITAAGP